MLDTLEGVLELSKMLHSLYDTLFPTCKCSYLFSVFETLPDTLLQGLKVFYCVSPFQKTLHREFKSLQCLLFVKTLPDTLLKSLKGCYPTYVKVSKKNLTPYWIGY